MKILNMFFCGISFCCMTFAQKVPEGDIIKNLVVNGSFENPDKTWVPGENWWFNPNGYTGRTRRNLYIFLHCKNS